jgi:hypothetical protein
MVFNATFNNISFVKFITIEMYMYIFFRWLFLREWIFQSNLASKANPVMRNEPIIISLHIYFLLYIQWCRLFGYYSKTLLCYLAFQYFDIEHTWWRLFQKRVMRTKFDIYAFIFFTINLPIIIILINVIKLIQTL